MAKKLARTLKNAQKQGRQNARRRSQVPAVSAAAADYRLRSHINMVRDPCHAVVGPTAYRGKDGFINRFSAVYDTIATGPAADNSTAIVAYWPRYNRVFIRLIPSLALELSINFYDANFSFAGPGGAFLGANAGETRPVAACISTSYVGTELNRQGLLMRGVIPYSTITGTMSLGALRQLCQQYGRTSDHEEETKWIPTSSDEEYEQVPGSAPSVFSDDNVIIHVASGFAAGTLAFSHKITHLQEWQPFYGLGIQCPTPNTSDPPAGLERVRSALATMGHWWLEGTKTASAALNLGANVVGGMRMLGVASSRAAPLLLGM